jgi:hypothetical protein
VCDADARNTRQFMEQEPGPRGSPHVPQAPAGAAANAEGAGAFELTANTDSCFSSSALAHEGQLGD